MRAKLVFLTMCFVLLAPTAFATEFPNMFGSREALDAWKKTRSWGTARTETFRLRESTVEVVYWDVGSGFVSEDVAVYLQHNHAGELRLLFLGRLGGQARAEVDERNKTITISRSSPIPSAKPRFARWAVVDLRSP